MNPIKFSRRDPNGSDPFIDAARIVSWQAIERGSRIALDTGDSVLVGNAPNAVLGLLNQARKEATMPAELAWTRELPTKPGLYVVRFKEAQPAALILWKLPTGELRDDQGFDYDDDDLAPEGMEFLGPLPE